MKLSNSSAPPTFDALCCDPSSCQGTDIDTDTGTGGYGCCPPGVPCKITIVGSYSNVHGHSHAPGRRLKVYDIPPHDSLRKSIVTIKPEKFSDQRSESASSCQTDSPFSCNGCPDFSGECPDDCFADCSNDCPNDCLDVCVDTCPDVCPDVCPDICPDVCPDVCPDICSDVCQDVCAEVCTDACDIDIDYSCCYEDFKDLPLYHCPDLSNKIDSVESLFYCHWGDDCDSFQFTSQKELDSHLRGHLEAQLPKTKSATHVSNNPVELANEASCSNIQMKQPMPKLVGSALDATTCSPRYSDCKVQVNCETDISSQYSDSKVSDQTYVSGFQSQMYFDSDSGRPVSTLKSETGLKSDPTVAAPPPTNQLVSAHTDIIDTSSDAFLSCQWDSCSLTAKEIDDILEHVRNEHLAQGIKPHHFCAEHDLDNCQHVSIPEAPNPHSHKHSHSHVNSYTHNIHPHYHHLSQHNSQPHFHCQGNPQSSYITNYGYAISNAASAPCGYSQIPVDKSDSSHTCCAPNQLLGHLSENKLIQPGNQHHHNLQLHTPAHTPTHPQPNRSGITPYMPLEVKSSSDPVVETSSELLPCEWGNCDFSALTLHDLDLHISQLHDEQSKSFSHHHQQQQQHHHHHNHTRAHIHPQQTHSHNPHGHSRHVHSQYPSGCYNGEYDNHHHYHNPSHHNYHHHNDEDLVISIPPKRNTKDEYRSTVDVNPPYICQWMDEDHECSRQFGTCGDLNSHIINDHIGSRKSIYVCNWKDCDRDSRPFTQRQKMIRHLLIHTKFRPFTCEECGATFGEESVLKQHSRIHSGEKPFSCNICGKSFAANTALSIHLRTHTGEKPLVCKWPGCNKRFSESSNLAKHMKTHDNERKHMCSFPGCGKRFRRQGQLERHSKLHYRCPSIKSEEYLKSTRV